MAHPKYRDIEVRGTVYPTVNAAARALRVQPQTVMKAIRAGRLAAVGTGASHPEPLPVRIRGRDFPHAKAAAAHFGLRPNTIHAAIARGAEHRVGLPRDCPANMSKAVQLGPLRFTSMAAADRALGFPYGSVSMALRRGGGRMHRIIRAAMELAARRDQQVGAARGKADA
ncbi:hypothetical protein [Pseudorhodobacter sp.]|uniref:hypothetical protein n=1 Tax=Pseudorhodobacter sp. TaxID=1934400 RepID=UPI00264935F9|nr:hypothetical protein [Pseudorhodobacter sp.]MDN5789035.1 helix-turn-helix domain-containing protein [Pseudorhodobacter sp.]